MEGVRLMGRNLAYELANGISDISLEQAIQIHLRGNHYPPVPLSMVQPCIDAIHASYDNDINRMIDLPEGVLFRGSNQATAEDIIYGHNLHAWCYDVDSDECTSIFNCVAHNGYDFREE
jgi:hypothetical protein